MSDVLTKCEVCHGLIDEEDLFCANCGAEAPHQESTQPRDTSRQATHNFECQGCGASMSYDAGAQTLRCPFCGSERLDSKDDARVLAPSRVVPFQVSRDSAIQAMRAFLGKGFWRPSDLSESAAVVKMAPVYVPYWIFSARTHTFWSADTNQLPISARGDWQPLTGEHRGEYSNLLVGASGALTRRETSAICPFDMNLATSPDQADLENHTVEQFQLQRRYARPLARQGLETMEAGTCERLYVPGKCRNMKVNTRIEGLTSEPVLLPVWIMAYRYRDRVFRFLVNGQTGRTTGQAPISKAKVLAASVTGVALLLLVLILLGLFR